MKDVHSTIGSDVVISPLVKKFETLLDLFDHDDRDYFALVDPDYNFLALNTLFKTYLEATVGQVEGSSIKSFVEEDEFVEYLDPSLIRCFLGETVKSNHAVINHFCANDRFFDFSCYPIKNDAGIVEAAMVVFHDVTRNKVTERKLRQLAHLDPLTQLPNLRFIDFQLRKIQAQSLRDGSGFSVVFIDFDRFKQVNDQNGHSVGDQVLIEFARRLRSKLRGGEYISRIGGDEFLVVIREALDDNQKVALVDRLRAATRLPMNVSGGKTVELEISIGIAVWPVDGNSLEELKNVADMRMYADKQHVG